MPLKKLKENLKITFDGVKKAGSQIGKALKNRKKDREAYFNSNVNPQSAYKNGKKKK